MALNQRAVRVFTAPKQQNVTSGDFINESPFFSRGYASTNLELGVIMVRV